MKYFICSLALLFSSLVHAQQSIYGRLVDAATGQGIYVATVSVYTLKDTLFINYGLSTTEGDFVVTGLPPNTSCLLIGYASGRVIYRKKVDTRGGRTIDLGRIRLAAESPAHPQLLSAIEIPPIRVFKDSLVLNTVPLNPAMHPEMIPSNVRMLLAKLPGIHREDAGLYSNAGQKITAISLDRSQLRYFQ